MKILFSGGGTLGSVMPLLAIREFLADHNGTTFCWVGTESGPEQNLIESESIPYYAIKSAKFRRYLALQNFLIPFSFFVGLLQAIIIIYQEKPDLCITAGGFVSVPVHLAAYLTGTPTWVHQQDIKAGLANKIMAWFASKVTVALPESTTEFPRKNIECIGNPIRKGIYQGRKEQAKNKFNIDSNKPVLFALGGGTGAREINQLIISNLGQLDKLEVIHVTGPERDGTKARKLAEKNSNYHVVEFIEEDIRHVYALADIVVARAGFSTLSELTALNIPAILVPKQGHQEKNARIFAQSGQFLNLKNSNLSLRELMDKLLEIQDNSNKFNKEETLAITKSGKIKEIIESLIQIK